MAQAPWSIKVDQETKDRIDAALEKIVEDGAAATKGEALPRSSRPSSLRSRAPEARRSRRTSRRSSRRRA